MWYSPQNQRNDIERSNLFINITIFALTIGIVCLSQRSVRLNAQNVRLNTLNVELNARRELRQPAENQQREEMLETLREINNKLI